MTNTATATITRKLAADLRVGDVVRTQGSRYRVRSLTFHAFTKAVRIDYVGLDRLDGVLGHYTDPNLYFLHVED